MALIGGLVSVGIVEWEWGLCVLVLRDVIIFEGDVFDVAILSWLLRTTQSLLKQPEFVST